MNSVLENLYYGEIWPDENDGLDGNVDLRAAYSVISNCEEKLTELLDGKEKKLFLDLCNAYSESEAIIAYEKFKYGFALGAKMIIEIFAENCENLSPTI